MKTTVLAPQEELYDVTWLKLDLQMDNMTTSVAGSATTKAVVTGGGMTAYCFELDSSLTVDSVRVNGAAVGITTQSNGLRSAGLGSPLAVGSTFTATVWYHGTLNATSTVTSWTSYGLMNYVSHSGHRLTLTNSSFLHADDWWPAKQSFTDKIDSVDLWFTVPDSCQAASNGLLKSVVSVAGGRHRYEWKSRYPIDFYLVAVTVAPYFNEQSYLHYTDGTGDSTLLQNFYYETSGDQPDWKARFDSVGPVIDYFSGLMGRYPFWKEKYGHCAVPNMAGFSMEHQTLSTMNWYDMTLVAHELGHQWWGDLVTLRSFRDIWLNEGFANFTEYLYLERFNGAAAARAYRAANFQAASVGFGTVICNDTTNGSRVFDSRLTYKKGGAALHMLRRVVRNDSAFFAGLRAYRQQHAFGTAVTEELKASLEASYGRNLDTFFNQWIYGEGVPIFSGAWNRVGSSLVLRIDQTTTSPSSVALFSTPLDILVKSSAGDTVVTVYNNASVQYFTFNWNKPVTWCVIDPDYHLLKAPVGALPQDGSLAVPGQETPSHFSVQPNPAAFHWTVSGLGAASTLRLTDLSGRLLWQKQTAAGTEVISAASLPVGCYLLTIQSKGSTLPVQCKLLKH